MFKKVRCAFKGCRKKAYAYARVNGPQYEPACKQHMFVRYEPQRETR